MIYVGFTLALSITAFTVFLLLKSKASPSIVLLSMGLIMFILTWALDIRGCRIESGLDFINAIFSHIHEIFNSRLASSGLLIMLYGGYIEFTKRVGAADAMIYILMRPMSALKQYPYLSSTLIIPIGLLLYLAIPSATTMGLLLMGTIYPVLLGLGISRVSALVVIASCTIFDVGFGSVNSNTAAATLGIDISSYLDSQMSYMAPLAIILAIGIFIVNKKGDTRLVTPVGIRPYSISTEDWDRKAPLFFAIFPILPIIILLCIPLKMLTTSTMSAAIVVAFLISAGSVALNQLITGKKNFSMYEATEGFWSGFGAVCASAVALMICADFFSRGLVSLGFVDVVVEWLGKIATGGFISLLLLAIVTFASVIVVGSSVSFFSAIAPMISQWAEALSIEPEALTITIQLIPGFARTASPIAAVIITISKIAGVSPLNLTRRCAGIMLVISLATVVLTYIFY